MERMWLPALPFLPFQSAFWSEINWEALARFVLFLNARYLPLSQLQLLSQGGIPPHHTSYFVVLENCAEVSGFVTMKLVSESET